MSLSINYHREGDGPPLVLLHGVGHHWQAWEPVIERLAGELDVIACDSPGFGRSAALAPSIEPTIPAYADAFEWFFAELGIERPHVAGNSMGGAIALELARRRAVRSVTTFSPAGFWTPAELRFCQLSLRALAQTPAPARPAVEALARTRRGRIALFSQTFGYPARLPAEEAVATLRDAWASPAFAGALDAFRHHRFEHPEQLRSTPITIAWGRRDRLLPYHLQAPRARAALPWATHVTLGAGHVPFYDDPAAVAEVIRARARSAVATTHVVRNTASEDER
jgi:pimeloyl-ACP methyl ester carboxylesterase